MQTCTRCGSVLSAVTWQCVRGQFCGLNRKDTAIAKRIDACFNSRTTDERTVAERRWKAPLKAPKPQAPCDHGLFSDEASQLDLVEMFQDPTNEE